MGELHTSILNERWVLDNLAAITNDHSVENLLELMYNAVLCSNICIRICFKLSTGIQQRWMFTGEFLWDLWIDRLQYSYEITKMQTMWLYYSWLTALLPLHGSCRILAALSLALDCSVKFFIKVCCITGSQGIITFPPQSRTHYYVFVWCTGG